MTIPTREGPVNDKWCKSGGLPLVRTCVSFVLFVACFLVVSSAVANDCGSMGLPRVAILGLGLENRNRWAGFGGFVIIPRNVGKRCVRHVVNRERHIGYVASDSTEVHIALAIRAGDA